MRRPTTSPRCRPARRPRRRRLPPSPPSPQYVGPTPGRTGGRAGEADASRCSRRRKLWSARSPASWYATRRSRPRPVVPSPTVSSARARTDRRHSADKPGRPRQRGRPVSCGPASRRRHGISRRRDQEHAAEREQRLAVAARRIGGGDPLAISRLEAAALGFVERREQREEPGPLGPFLDRVGALQHLQIFGLPDVERGGQRRQQVVIERRARRPATGRSSGSSTGRHGPPSAVSVIEVCDGAPKLRGICTASTPPAPSAPSRPTAAADGPSSQCSAAFE